MIKEKRQQSAEIDSKRNTVKSVPGYPVYPPVVSYSYRTEHITPIPPNRAMHQLTVCSVNTAEIRLSSSHGVSSDPEQKDVFSSYRCQRASENSATPLQSLSRSLCHLVSSRLPASRKRQRAKQPESRGIAVQ